METHLVCHTSRQLLLHLYTAGSQTAYMQAFSLRTEATYEVFPEQLMVSKTFFTITGGQVPDYHETSTGTPKFQKKFNTHGRNANPPIPPPITFPAKIIYNLVFLPVWIYFHEGMSSSLESC
jgi:hypothetical protein